MSSKSDILEGLARCALAHEPGVRLVGNVRAGDIADAVSEVMRIIRELGQYSLQVWDDEDFRDGYSRVNSGLIVDASKFCGGKSESN